MSCFLCDSFHHVSQYCDKYVSDEDRKEIMRSKVISTNKSFAFLHNCYICCSRSHNTILCPDRFTAPNFFVPNIDHILLHRFLAVLDPVEKFTLACQTQTVFNLCTLGLHLFTDAIIDKTYRRKVPEERTYVTVCKDYEIPTPIYHLQMFEKAVFKKRMVFAENVKVAFLHNYPVNISVILSSRTKRLTSKNEICLKVTMDEIFKNAPKLEELNFDAWHDDFWRIDDDLFKYGYGKNFKKLTFSVNYDFNPVKLVHFLNKEAPNVKIDLLINVFPHLTNQRQYILQKMSKYFVKQTSLDRLSLSLYFKCCFNQGSEFAGSFVLKNFDQ